MLTLTLANPHDAFETFCVQIFVMATFLKDIIFNHV